MNVSCLLSDSASKFPRREAVVSDQGRMDFAQLDRRVSRLAGAMLAAGLRRGERVAILFLNGAAFVETYFAALRVGLVATPVNFRLVVPEITHILNDSGAAALFYGPEFSAVAEAVRPMCSDLRLVVGKADTDYDTFLNDGTPVPCETTVLASDPCQIMYTSGTTGKPKGAVLTHGNILWNLINTMLGRQDREGRNAVIVGPLSHTAALNNHLTIQVALGGKSVLVSHFEPEALLRTIAQEKINLISGAPAFYNLLMQAPRAWDFDRSAITTCTAGADKLTAETKRRLMEFFPNIKGVFDVYGCTEASPSITILDDLQSLTRHGSVGKPLPFLEARIVDPAGHPLAPGEVGEVAVRGANVMQGYHRQPEATARAMRDGWLFTGDLARMDEDGFFYIIDRMKDMIVSGGENIYPREIEEVLVTHPAVADAAVVGEPDELWGESVKAVVVVKTGLHLDAVEVVRYCRSHLASYKKPRKVVFAAELPRTASGKVQKHRLKEMA
ncbi:MAG: long-chain fatty acid--CoA ligase [Desulfatitalea sp.]|nr:long-chain fatty acid--CoA ligase [Desulfatitalea sp.]